MKDLSAAERRLIAALDRLDHAVERAARRIAEMPADAPPPPGPSAGAAAQGADAGISPQIAALHDRQAATLEAMQMRLAEAHERLAAAGEQVARLAAANDELARANRALMDAAGGPDAWTERGEGAMLSALQAEIESLRAARTAEVAQMSEILDALDRMLGVTTAPRSHSTEVRGQGGRGDRAAPPLDRRAEGRGRDDAAPAQNEGAALEDILPEEDSLAPDRELSVLRDEDPLPEDELAPEAEDQQARAGAARPEDPAAETEKERR